MALLGAGMLALGLPRQHLHPLERLDPEVRTALIFMDTPLRARQVRGE